MAQMRAPPHSVFTSRSYLHRLAMPPVPGSAGFWTCDLPQCWGREWLWLGLAAGISASHRSLVSPYAARRPSIPFHTQDPRGLDTSTVCPSALNPGTPLMAVINHGHSANWHIADDGKSVYPEYILSGVLSSFGLCLMSIICNYMLGFLLFWHSCSPVTSLCLCLIWIHTPRLDLTSSIVSGSKVVSA